MPQNISLIINGERVQGAAAAFDVINPADKSVAASGNHASVEQLDAAVAAARAAFKSWSKTSHEERQRLLNEIADKIEANGAELAEIIVKEQGKPLSIAQIEVGGAAAWTRYNASLEVPVKVIEDSEEKYIASYRKPLGVVGSITPWNWPLMIAVWHIMPALRTGNTVVIKPSGMTPENTQRLVEIINEVLPDGVVNMVLGEREIGEAISGHQDINKLIFTGSTPTGQGIMANAAGTLKRLTLELGGNDAAIVLPDADVDAQAEAIFNTAFVNMGQTCAALKRLYVHESIYDALCEKLAAIADSQVVGNGMNADTTFGPIQNESQYHKVIELVEDARAHGAKILSGGKVTDDSGFYYPPTIVANVSNGVRIVDEEQFGPALPVIKYSTIEEALELANDCPYGLGASVWGSDIAKANEVASQMESGTVWINNHAEVLPHAPFGGSKLSGLGVEFGVTGLLEYTQLQVVNTKR